MATRRTAGERLAEQHKAFKENAARVLHEAGDRKDLCGTFDQILVSVGLPPRPQVVEQQLNRARRYARDAGADWGVTVEVKAPEPTGEDTVEAFEEWKRNAANTLHAKAQEYGIGSDYHDVLREAGFPARTRVNVVIEGTFSVPATAWVFDGEDAVTGIQPVSDIANPLYDTFNRGYFGGHRDDVEVDWKARVADGGS
jgi:hypothetical protein